MADQERTRKPTISRTINDKLKLLRDLRTLYNNSLHQAERETGIERKLWRYWLKRENAWLEMQDKRTRRRADGGGRKMFHPALDAAMLEWFTEERRQKRAVTFRKFRQKALNVIAPQLQINVDSFRLSLSLYKFYNSSIVV